MAKKSGKAAKCIVESLFDLNPSNVWSVDGFQIAGMWKKECSKEGFAVKEEKLLNIIRSAFEVVHYDPEDGRSKQKYENGEWATFSSVGGRKGEIAIRQKQIKRLADLNRENVKRITAATVLELIDRNFGGGWDSVPPATKEIIEGDFDVSTTQQPTSRIHAAGGTFERKVKSGYEVLEIAKGTWTEAIFVKKKEPVSYPVEEDEPDKYDEDDGMLTGEEEGIIEEEENIDEGMSDEEYTDNEAFYSSYIEDASLNEEEGEDVSDGFIIEEG